ncbi:MAG: DNA repair protein RecO [Clostridia bacterium]|nr:DNA repair protein RecO [Clostridia bacterium]
MPTLLRNGIVLRYANYKESDRILTIFTREQGLISASARGCRRPKSPLLGASEPFVYGEFALFERNGGKYTVDACDVRESFYPIREDVSRFAGGMSMLLLTEKSGATENGEALFSLLYYALSFLSYGKAEPADITICFFVRALHQLGLRPALTECACCGKDLRARRQLRFAPQLGGAVCGECVEAGTPIQALSLEAMRRMLLLRDEDMDKVRLPAAVRAELKGAMRAYASYILEYDFKSFDQI